MEFCGNTWFKKQTLPLSLSELCYKFKKVIKKETNNKFDYIACQGVSGAFIASPLSISIKKPCLITLKDKDNSHGMINKLCF